MGNEELEYLMLTDSPKRMKDVTIDFFPIYQDVNEKIPEDSVHENFFQWTRPYGQWTYPNFHKQNTSVTFLGSCEFDGTYEFFKWKNEIPIDLSGLPSVQRILMIRDITQRLRLLDERTDESNKMLTRMGQMTINFKLEDVEFSLLLAPKKKQPGNAFLRMQSNASEPYGERHDEVERFDCFAKLDAKEIDSIVSRARRTGMQITGRDINISEEDEVKQKMAEEMNFFMLLYDFEVARRLQRPFVPYSHVLDALPIGIGIAMIHRINSKRANQRWIFFSGLFQGTYESRLCVLDGIVNAYKEWNEPRSPWSEADLINMLCEQFGS